MRARGGDLHGAPREHEPAHVGEVGDLVVGLGRIGRGVVSIGRVPRRPLLFTFEARAELGE